MFVPVRLGLEYFLGSSVSPSTRIIILQLFIKYTEIVIDHKAREKTFPSGLLVDNLWISH